MWIAAAFAEMKGLEFHNFSFYWTHNVIFLEKSASYALEFEFLGRTVIRYWTANSLRTGANFGTGFVAYFEHLVEMSPMFDILNAGIHADGYQAASGEEIKGLTIDRWDHIYADGTASACQTFFTRNGSVPVNPDPSNPSYVGVTIRKLLSLGRAFHVLNVNGSNATYPFVIDKMVALTQWSGRYGGHGNIGLSTVYAHRPKHTLNPRLGIEIANSNYTASDVVVQGTIANDAGVSLPGSVVAMNDTTGNISAYYPNASWITSAALRTTALANDVDYYNGVDDIRWHGTLDEVLTDVYAALDGAIGVPNPNDW